MARVIKNTFTPIVSMNIVKSYSDGTSDKTVINKDDVMTLRYNDNGEAKIITGRVSDFTISSNKVTIVNLKNPKDNFSSDVKITTLFMDISEQYQSNVVEIPVNNVLENIGEEIDKISIIPTLEVGINIKYSNETEFISTIKPNMLFKDAVFMAGAGKPDIVGDFEWVAWGYSYNNKTKNVTIDSMYVVPKLGGKAFKIFFKDIIKYTPVDITYVTDPDTLNEIRTAMENDDFAYVKFMTDVDIPITPAGKISTIMIPEGKEVEVDLNGHILNVVSYAFYVNGGVLTLKNTSVKSGKILCNMLGKTYPGIQVQSGKFIMESGIIDTTNIEVPAGQHNWLYGVVCATDGVFEMRGGKVITDEAACISICNGTASGAGSQFIISGDSVLYTKNCCAVYLADNKTVLIKDNARVLGGIIVRMGDIIVQDNGYVEGSSVDVGDGELSDIVVGSGCCLLNPAIVALTGCYNSNTDIGNDLNIIIKKGSTVKSKFSAPLVIGTLNTLYDQNVTVDVESSTSFVKKTDFKNYVILTHDDLAAIVTKDGKTMREEATVTNLTMKINGKKVTV